MKKLTQVILCSISIIFCACNDNDDSGVSLDESINLSDYFTIDFSNLPNYSNQDIPNYINKDNTTNNPITDNGAILGRVLFYDKNLSTDNSVSCSTCHIQANAFSDLSVASTGVNGETGRHSMRLINSRFANETNFFWDERASTLEEQTTMPIQDHNEMGFSGENGDPGIDDLIVRLETIPYYADLFTLAFGNETITEERMQNAMAQFIRSIQSFDSKYDVGRNSVNNDMTPFTNFSDEENDGKQLFFAPATFNNGQRIGGGVGCNVCHNAPEFDIDPNSLNNGVINTISGTGPDIEVTRSPTLRDVFKSNGDLNGPLMHSGLLTIDAVLNHYNNIPVDNANLDNRLRPQGNLQQLNLTAQERINLTAFLKTLSGTNVYTDDKWSNPFIN